MAKASITDSCINTINILAKTIEIIKSFGLIGVTNIRFKIPGNLKADVLSLIHI